MTEGKRSKVVRQQFALQYEHDEMTVSYLHVRGIEKTY